jgi:tRNA nucleotidyltransferase (CCA-adding enzyme)
LPNYKGKIDFMQKDLRRLLRDPNLIPFEKQALLSKIATQAASMGMPCYLVGGFVRDLLLERPLNDFDIVVVGDAIKVGNALMGKIGGRLITHNKFRTAVWNFNENESHDLITARSEIYEHPGALPTIQPSTIEADLLRRDFTINAMAVRLDGEKLGELIDPLNGKEDLEQRLIRVLHPDSFMDDPTRIFRAIRYESRYEFKIEPDTLKLVNQESLEVLSKLSGERIRHEFDLIFEEDRTPRIMMRAIEIGLFGAFLPELPRWDESYGNLLNSTPPEPFNILYDRVLLSYLLWFMDTSEENIVPVSKRLDFSSVLTESLLALTRLKIDLPGLLDCKPSEWTKRLDIVPPAAIYALWMVTGYDALKEYLIHWRNITTKITGYDLKASGLPPGPRYKEILSRLRAAWLDGEINNEDQEKGYLKTLL